jgi:hypothetical protein
LKEKMKIERKQNMTSNMLTNTIKHFNLVTRHRWVVFKLCCKAGIPWRGLVHDLSKFSPTEFWESVKYYNGSMSPILFAKRKQGYSKAWLHHKGRNKHHPEYWYDPMSRNPMPVIPYKYIVEMICDNLAAGIVYNGKRWRNDTQLKYWNSRKDNMPLNEKNKSMVTEVFTQVSINGIEKTITKSNLKRLYKKYCE